MKNIMKQGLVALAVLASVGSASAATATGNFNATANITDTCVVTATDVAFGDVNASSTTDFTATGTIKATCTNGKTYDLTINGGVGGNVAQRAMSNAGDAAEKLNYNLYSDAGHGTLFGDTLATGVNKTGNGAEQTTTVYGKLPKAQYKKSGIYTDALVVTLAY